MSLRSRLVHPVRRFFSWLWLGKVDRLPDVLRRPARHRKREDTKLELQSLEPRETPLDLFGMLSNGFMLGGLPLLTGLLRTPAQVLLTGWDVPGMGMPFAQLVAGFSRPEPLQAEAPPRDGSVLAAGLLPPQEAASFSPGQQHPEPARPAGS